MWDIVRDSAAGKLLRHLGGEHLAPYPEEHPEFVDSASARASQYSYDEEASALGQTYGSGIVTWYGENDPENPHNWSSAKKAWISALLFAYTFAAYIGSSIYTSSSPDISKEYGVNDTVSSLGLALYVLAYGVGPMIFSPLSEIPVIGRNLLYIVTFFIFVLICVGMIFVQNIGGILVLRFLLGFFGSPCLATAAASYADFFDPANMPFVLAFWGGGATLSPALGPVVGGYAVQAEGWRITSWEMLWLSAPICLFLFFTLPETSADTILLRRAQCLRKQTGREDLKSESEVRQAKMNARQIAFDALIKPWQINALDPSILFTTFYTGLTYGIYYSFFESFPLVYVGVYGFSLGELGLAFIAVLVGLACAVALLVAYLYYIAPSRLSRYEPDKIPPEARIWPGLFATFLIPIGLFLFAWTSRPSIPWIVSLLGVAISMCGVFIIVQSMFVYLPYPYPRYAGSLFAANGLARSLFAFAAILFSPPMFARIDVSGGVSLLASLSALCILGMFCLYYLGPALRRRSKFSVS